jgi:integrase/recombinase XerD
MSKKQIENRKSLPWDVTIRKLVLDHELAAFRAVIPAGDSVSERREALMLWMLINTGIRASELCSLRVVDMPSMLGADFIEVYRGKRKKSRNVPVSKAFAQEIEDYIRDVRPRTLPKRFAKNSRVSWLFFDKRGRKLTRDQVYYLVKKTAKKAGIAKPVHPHMFRHRFATRALCQDGSNIYRVKSWMGHSSISITEKYLHLAGMLGGRGGEMLDQKNAGLRAV